MRSFKAFSSEVGTGSREENASNKNYSPALIESKLDASPLAP
jgi:hypothetical protein